jgi:hypothetical protein
MVKFKDARQQAIGTKTKQPEWANIKAVHSLWVDDDNITPIIKLDDDDSLDESVYNG